MNKGSKNMNSKHCYLFISLILIIPFFTSCDTGLKTMGSTEFGIKFSKLPPSIGGLPSEGSIVQRGQAVIVWPWENLYSFDTKKKIIEWGEQGEGDDKSVSDYVQTRALDGNEVSLAVRVEYRVSDKASELLKLVQEVATNEEEVRSIVESVARADIRTAMNELRTNEFFDNDKKFAGQEKIKNRMRARLNQYGIIIESVNLEEHRFERVASDGSVDTSYQEMINQVEIFEEKRKREESRIDTVRAQKIRELNDVKSLMNRKVEQAKGFLRQAKMRGDNYFKVKENEAKRITETGQSEIEGLKAIINAYKGKGGKAILKLELVKQLIKNDPKFVVLSRSGSGSNAIDVNRVDTNDLIKQAGLFEALNEKKVESKTK